LDQQTPVGEIAPYIARNTDVPTGMDVGVLTVLLRAPPNANVQVVQLGGYGAWGASNFPHFWLVPPDGETNLGASPAPNTYPLYNSITDLQLATITTPLSFYPSERFMNGAAIWIPAGWALAVAPSATTSGTTATFSAVGIVHRSTTYGR